MASVDEMLKLVALVLLSGYLYAKHRQRMRQQVDRNLGESHWPGTAMDVTVLRPRLRRVRADPALHAQARDAAYRVSLLAQARQTLGRLAFFHHPGEGHDPQTSPAAERPTGP